MNHRVLFPNSAKRVAIVATLFALLATVGCTTRPQAVMSPAGDSRARRSLRSTRPKQVRSVQLRAMSAAGPLRTLLVVSLAAAALCPRARASAWELDPSATRIEFAVRNLSMAHVDGRFGSLRAG